MAISTITIPPVPRSRFFKYYEGINTGNSGGSSNVWTQQTQNPSDNFGTGLNIIGTGNVVKSIANNATDDNIFDVTMGDAVTKIIAGNNISISPTTGIGDVTINTTGGINFTQTGTGNTIVTPLTYNTGTNTLASTLGYRFDTVSTSGSGNTVTAITGLNNQITATMGYRMASLSTSGSGNAVGSLSYSNGVLTQNMVNITGGGSSLNLSSPDYSNPSSPAFFINNLSYSSGTNTLTGATGSIGVSTSGSGNTITGLTMSSTYGYLDWQVNGTLGYRMASLSTSGSGNAVGSLSYSNGVLTQNMTTISGGSSLGNVVSNLASGQTTIKMFRYEYYLPSATTINGYQNYSITVNKSSISNMTSLYNYFPSLIYTSTSITPVSVILQIIDDGGSTFRILIVNCNSASVTVPANTEIDVLIFGN